MSIGLSTSATRPKVKHSTENILFGVDFTALLQSGETLTGTPTVTNATVTTPALTLGSPIVNTSAFTNDDGATVAIGTGVQVRISSGLSPTDYVLTVTCGTSNSNTRTMVCTLQSRDS